MNTPSNPGTVQNNTHEIQRARKKDKLFNMKVILIFSWILMLHRELSVARSLCAFFSTASFRKCVCCMLAVVLFSRCHRIFICRLMHHLHMYRVCVWSYRS